MAWVKKANLRGPRGYQGLQGLPGVNAIENDAAVAAYVGDDDSATTLALRGNYARGRQAPLEVNEDFSLYPDGDLLRLLTGQEWETLAYQSESSSLPRIIDGRMTYDDPGRGGGYASVQLARSVRRMGAAWAFTPESVDGGSMTLAATTNLIGSGTLGPMSFHLRIENSLWALGVVDGAGSSVTDLHVGSFATALATDSTTIHETEVILDTEAGRAYVRLPDGQIIRSRQHDAFKQACTWGFWEIYRNPAALPVTGQSKTLFKRAWASSLEPDSSLSARSIEAAKRPMTPRIIPGPDQNFTNSTVELGGAGQSRLISAIPSTGQWLFRVSGWIENDADFTGRNRLLLCNDSMAELTSADLDATPGYKGTFTVLIPYAVDPTVLTNAPGKPTAFRLGLLSPSASNKSRIRIGTSGLVSRCVFESIGY